MEGKFIGCESSFDDADIVLFGVRFDATSTYRRGSAQAPLAVRRESYGIETYSPYLDADLADYKIHDAGDIAFIDGRANAGTMDDLESMLQQTHEKTWGIISAGKFPMMLGGEHLVTLGAFRAIAQKHKDVCIIHFDAHTDLREDWEGNPYNHSTVIRRCYDLVGKDRIFQFGIRSGEKHEFEWAQENTFLVKNNFEGLSNALKIIGDRPIYFTIDVDVLDPSEMPGTGTPEAGGVRFLELLSACKEVFQIGNVVGCDITEHSPMHDTNGASTALVCKLLREILLLTK